jgi:signal transduction histidine kinase
MAKRQRRDRQELEAMVSIANVLAGPEPFGVKARKMLVEMKTLSASDMAVLRLPAAEESGLRAVADSGPGKLRAKPTAFVRYGQTTTTLAYERGEAIVDNHYAANPRAHPSVVAQGINSLAALPLQVRRMTLGTVSLTAGTPDHFTPERVQLLTAVASELGVLVENARLREQTEHRLVELHAAHEQLQSLSQRLFEVQETERRHIARELHDEIGQLLTALQLLLDITERSPAQHIATNLPKVQALLQELMNRVRYLSLDLRPPMLDDLGLLPALIWQMKRYTTQSQVAVDFRHAGLEGRRFHPDLETAAFRIVQEALTNVARHAGVKHAAVRLWSTDAALGV